ncbi:hypothetical protein AB4142_18900 [Variovorax sp. 2RAF20]
MNAPHYLFDGALDLESVGSGIDVSEESPSEYLERMNGRLRLDVPHVATELKVPMRGTVPVEWSLA